MTKGGVMGRPVTFDASERVLQIVVPIAGQRQIESGNFRYGPTNVIAEFLDWVADNHAELFQEFAGQSRQSKLPGVEYRDVADPEPKDRRTKQAANGR